MTIPSKPVDTPTVERLKAKLALKVKEYGVKTYWFVLTEKELKTLLHKRVGWGAIVVYSLIRGAAQAAPGQPWVTLRLRVREAVNRDYQFWHTATERLVTAKFIECKRHRGRLPQFRILKRTKVTGGDHEAQK